MNLLKTAAQYLLVLHTLKPLDSAGGLDPRADAAARLLDAARAAGDIRLCRELLRFLRAADDSGAALRDVVERSSLGASDHAKEQRE
jgi:hypothetical protein